MVYNWRMDSRRPTLEHGLYFLAFLIAAALRFLRLGDLPLSDPEAALALQSLALAQAERPLLGPEPAYLLLTGAAFFLFGGTETLARFWPALAGSLLVLAPYAFRSRLGSLPALLLAFGLAVDPGLTALSRQAGGAALALFLLVLAWAAWQAGRFRAAGAAAGLALLSGPSVWMGLLGLLLTWLLLQGLRRPDLAAAAGQPLLQRLPQGLRPALAYAAGALLFGGTLFFLAPGGLSAWLASLPAFLTGWWRPGDLPAGVLLVALLAYQPLGLALGLAAVWRGWGRGDQQAMHLSFWLLVALLLALFYPARQPADLAWALLPLWALAALELSRHCDLPAEDRWETAGLFALTLVIGFFLWFNLSGFNLHPPDSQIASLHLALIIGALALLGISITLVGLGWSLGTARRGAVWGGTALLLFYTLGSAWGASGLRTPGGVELWQPAPAIPQADLLRRTVADLSEWSRGHVHDLPVVVREVESDALRWALRSHSRPEEPLLDPAAVPPLVITPLQAEPGLPAAYRGQDFVWRRAVIWSSLQPLDWLAWLTTRKLPQESEVILLWARDDLFLDASP
jgi:hypothetical protein